MSNTESETVSANRPTGTLPKIKPGGYVHQKVREGRKFVQGRKGDKTDGLITDHTYEVVDSVGDSRRVVCLHVPTNSIVAVYQFTAGGVWDENKGIDPSINPWADEPIL